MDPKVKLGLGAAGIALALWLIWQAERLARKRSAVLQFIRKNALVPAGRRGRARIYSGRVRDHAITLSLGSALEIAVTIQAAVPEGFSVKMHRMAPSQRIRLWLANGEMDPQFFDAYAGIRAKNAVELKDYMTERRKTGLRKVLWLGKVTVDGGQIVYRKFGPLARLGTLEQMVKLMVDAAIMLEIKF